MTQIAKIFKFLVTLASLLTSIQAIVRLAKFAWNLWLQLKKVFKAMPSKSKTFKGFGTFRPRWAS